MTCDTQQVTPDNKKKMHLEFTAVPKIVEDKTDFESACPESRWSAPRNTLGCQQLPGDTQQVTPDIFFFFFAFGIYSSA